MKKIILILLSLISISTYSQNDCMGAQSSVVNPQPVGGGYAPGTVVQYCITYNNWNTGFNTNWCEGFDITIGPGWVPGSITPTTYPNDNSGAGQWVWIPGTFNGNGASSGGAGNNFGPGFFYDYNGNGQSVDDWGDNSTGPWTFCFSITAGAVPGASLSLQVSPVSDGYAGSWINPGCNGVYQYQLSPGSTVLGCLTPPVISQQSVTDASCNGANDGNFAVSVVNGSAPFSYTINGVSPAIFGGNAFYSNLIAGNYVVVCTDDDGCVSNTINIIVNENSSVQNSTAQLQDVLCNGESTGSFQVSSINGLPPYTYTLGAVSNLTGQFNNLSAGNYIVTVTDDNGCSNFHNVSINENAPIVSQIVLVDDASCFGGTDGDIELSCIGGTAPYNYSIGSITNTNGVFSDVLPAGNHLVTIEDINGCQIQQNIATGEASQISIFPPIVQNVDCFGNSTGEILIFANGGTPPYTYTLGTLNNITGVFSNLPVGNYQITVTDVNSCVYITNQITILGPNLPLSSTFTTTDPICFGSSDGQISINVNGGTSPYVVNWNSIPAQVGNLATNLSSGIYQATITDDNGCQLTNSATLFQPDDIILNTVIVNSTCIGQPIQLDVTQQNAIVPYTITWSNNIDATIVNNLGFVTPQLNTVYTAQIVDANGCGETDNQLVVVNPLPDPSFSTSVITGCDPLCIDFIIDNSNPNYQYVWDFGDGNKFIGISDKHCYGDDGIFTIFVDAITDLGCRDSLRKTDLIIVNKSPTAEFSITPETITTIDKPDFKFENLSQDADLYFWSFGDGLSSQEESPEHTYFLPNSYCVKLVTVANYTTGIPTCADSITHCLTLIPLSVCYVPNSFTPNNDGYNDIFKARGSMISSFEITIFNRWGEQVYRSFDMDNGWDGTYGRNFSPDGIYFYTVKYRDVKFKPFLIEGTVTLIR